MSWRSLLFGWLFSLLLGWLLSLAIKCVRGQRIHKERVLRQFPALECLEDRVMMDWKSIGPAPQSDPSHKLGADNTDSGRISALAITYPDSSPQLLLGTASGGVWYTSNLSNNNNNPTWTVTNTDTLGLSTLNLQSGSGAGFIDTGALAVDPTDRNIVYDGTGEANSKNTSRYGSGILKSTDGGKTWSVIATGTPNNPLAFVRQSITKIIVDPSNHNTLYAAVVNSAKNSANDHDNGIYKSTNGGTTWALLTVPWMGTSPNNGPHIGQTITVTDLDYTWDSQDRTTVLYAGVASNGAADNNVGGFWRSTDGGDTWVHLGVQMRDPNQAIIGRGTPAPNLVGRVAFAADHRGQIPAPAIYAVVVKPDDTLENIYKSTDGINWTVVPNPGNFVGDQGLYDVAIGFDPGTERVFLGGEGGSGQHFIYESNATVTSWIALDKMPNDTQPHTDIHAFAFYQGYVYVATDGGIWRYNPDFANLNKVGTWTDLNTAPLSTNQVYSVGAKPDDPSTLTEASQDNGTALTTNQGNFWTTMYGGDGVFTRFMGMIKEGTVLISSQNGDIMHSNAYGNYMNLKDVGLPNQGNKDVYPFQTVFTVNPSSPTLLVGSRTSVLLGSYSAGAGSSFEFRTIGNNPVAAPDYITALAFAKSSGGGWNSLIFAGTNNGRLFRTSDGGKTWTQYNPPGGRPWGTETITGFAIDGGQHPGLAYLSVGEFSTSPATVGQVYETTDYGQTWVNVSGNRTQATDLPNLPVNTIILDPSSKSLPDIYAGTDAGVYVGTATRTGSRTWTRLNGLPNVQVKDLQLQTSPDGGHILVAATFGRGVWTIPLPEQSALNATEGASTALALGTFTGSVGSSPTISINWGDGSPVDNTTGTITVNGSTDTVTGTHTYAVAGAYAPTVTITPSGGSPTTLTSSVEVDDAPLTATADNFSGTSLTSTGNVTVATFTDPDTTTIASSFTASIDWGYGITSTGTVIGSNGSFTVQGSTTYEDAGSFPVDVTITDASGSIATVTDTATISGTVTATPVTVTATEGASTGTVPVASFTSTSQGPFTATIDWGDGHTSSGSVGPNGGGGYYVSGSDTYGEDGNYVATVTIQNNGTTAAILTNTVSVNDAPLAAIGLDQSASQAATLDNVVVARFTDPNLAAPLSDLSATIDWGDGSSSDGEEGPDDGVIVSEGNGVYAVEGSHSYLQAGSYSLTITISDAGGSVVTVNPIATVAAAPPTVTGLDTFSGPPQGGTPVTISGTNLTGATAVSFGGVAATFFTDNGDGTLTAIAPAGTSGTTVDVTVTTSAGTSATNPADQFVYEASPPVVTGLSASNGPTGGGSTLTVTGQNFGGATAVYFGSVAASDLTVLSSTSLTVTVPPGTAGTSDVTVPTPYGTSATSSADQYTYQAAAPTVTAVDPASGPSAGGALVTIVGTNLNTATQVSFNGTAATSFTVASSTTILATTPALTDGTYDITVTTSYGTSSTSSADQYTTMDAPTVSALSPSSGPPGGGSSVTITGTGFTNAVQVWFGITEATSFTINSDTSITAIAPDLPAGAVDVTVQSPGGTSAVVVADQYTYSNTAPTVTAVSPNQGPATTSTSVTITGTCFTDATAVAFGATPALDFTYVSPTEITAIAPPGNGTQDVTVTTPSGTSATSSADQFSYTQAPAPVVTQLSVSTGPTAGGTSVVLTGTGFSQATQVSFGAVPAVSFVVDSDTQITATAPSQQAGTVNVTVTTAFGSSAPATANQFIYQAAVPAVTDVSPATGSTAGGDTITVSGTGFSGATQVLFGSMPAASFTVDSDSSITAVSPIAAVGTVDVQVVTPSGISPTGSSDRLPSLRSTRRSSMPEPERRTSVEIAATGPKS